ncbi:putative bifunctional diguanylate cyclase/phosphodiesterase, partial [Acidisoma silvae]
MRDKSSYSLSSDADAMFRLLVQSVTDYAIYMLAPDGTVISWNAGAERAKGYSAAEIVGQNFSNFYTAVDRAGGLPQRALGIALSDGKFEGQGWRIKKNGSRFWATVVIESVYSESGQLIGFAKVTRDLSEHKRKADELRETKDSLDLALGNMSQGLILFSGQEQVVLSNARMAELLGLPNERLKRGVRIAEILHDLYSALDLTPGEIQIEVQHTIGQFRAMTASGKGGQTELKWGGRSCVLNHSAKTEDGSWVTTVEDVTERRVIEDRISHLAHHDALTDLPNRMSFRNRLESLIAEASGGKVTVLYIDLDRFKPVNDTFGHTVGDAALKIVSKRMQAQLRRRDIVARLGGDEFAILLFDNASLEDVRVLASRLLRELSRVICIGDFQISLGASIGIAMASAGETDPDILLRNADLALYRAKASGRGHYRFYEPGMELVMQQRQDLEHDLRYAIYNNEFSIEYQPIVSSKSNRLSSIEALLRWNNARRGNVPPADFIPFAEEIGLMPQIGDWVLRTACREALNWPDHIVVSINLSPTQFSLPNFVQSVTDSLIEVGFPPNRLELEITETAMIRDIAAAGSTLSRIRALGILVALDDFGTGYSSLSLLRTMPFTRIKIDRSFVQDLDRRADASTIIQAVVSMGMGIGVAVTAEGVETEGQAETLTNLGCDNLQGYLFSRPLQRTHLSEWIKNNSLSHAGQKEGFLKNSHQAM